MKSVLAIIFFTFSINSFASQVQTVPFLDVDRYMGKWYEIGRITQRFQRNCGASTAEYSLTKKGKVRVVNSCVRKDNNEIQKAYGVATVADTTTNSKLKVSFVPVLKWFGIFAGNYWVLALDEADYQYALVGDPTGEFLWMLSRTPELDQYTKEMLLDVAKGNGYTLENFEFIPSSPLL
jgi:apolipoprotein D and lipocalin family protein